MPSMNEDVSVKPAPRGRRNLWVVVTSSALALAVMAGVIVLGSEARKREDARRTGRYGVGDVYGDPYRRTPWPEDGCAPDRDHPPRMVFDLPPEGVDFGAVKQGVKLEREVTFKNEGSGPLCIRSVDGACGCLKARLLGSTRKFEPGESGTLHIAMETEGFAGPMQKRVTVYTNGVDAIRQSFDVRAVISRGLVVWPRKLTFPRTTKGKPSYATIHLREQKEGPDWEVTNVRGTVKRGGKLVLYTWQARPVEDPHRRRVNLVVTNPGMATKGAFYDVLIVETTHPDRAEVQIHSQLQVVPPILAVPLQAIVGFVPTERKVRVRLFPGELGEGGAFDVLDASFETRDGKPLSLEQSGFRAAWERGPDEIWSIDVSYEGAARRPGKTLVVLVVRTTHPEQPEVRIDCSATAEG